MNCKNCSAPMRLVRDRDYFVCDYCGTYHFPNANHDGVRVLNEPVDWLCPVCQTMLVAASLEDHRVAHCPNCKGLLIHQRVFMFAVQYLRIFADTYESPARALNRDELKRPLICTQCGCKMDTHVYGGPGNVVIDVCYACHWVWLDYGELYRIITAPGYDRGNHDEW